MFMCWMLVVLLLSKGTGCRQLMYCLQQRATIPGTVYDTPMVEEVADTYTVIAPAQIVRSIVEMVETTITPRRWLQSDLIWRWW
eukprot:2168314-Pyramimonas_sp.AAC.1